MPKNYSGQNLRGRNFKGQDLTGANFSHADIRGANFSDAILIGANFTKAKAGLQRRWATIIVIAAILLASSAGFFVAIAALSAAINLLGNDYVKSLTIFPGLVALSFAAIYIGIQLNQQRFTALPEAIARAVTLTTMAVGTLVGVMGAIVLVAGSGTITTAVAALLVGGLTAALDFCVQLTMSTVTIVAGVIPGLLVPILTVAGALIGAKFLVGNFSGAVVMLLLIAIAPVLQAIHVVHTILAGDENVALTRTVAIALASIRGTSFKQANLTDADFTEAILPSTDFTEAIITHTRFRGTKKLNRAKVGNSILVKQAVINLLVRGVASESYAGANLRGANLTGAELIGANFKGANISDATFQKANLENANLTLAEAIGTDFTSAQMTGACVEAWNIESSTKLDHVDCRFIYLLEYPKSGTNDRERRPSSGDFAPGEFTKLFQEVLSTVDLIFRNGVDWKAFIAAFKEVQVQNEDTELTIQSIENKGDGVVVVRVNVPPDTNKEKIHRELTQNYELALKAIEEKYQAKLESKDEQITLYRQQLEDYRLRERWQNSNMEKIIDILAKTAVNIPVNEREVKAIAERQTAVNLVILTLGTGDFEKGFPSIIAQIWAGNDRLPIQRPGELLPAPEIVKVYHDWQSRYKIFTEPLSNRLEKAKTQVTNVSITDLNKLTEELEEKLNKWLNAEQFQPIDRILRERFNRSDEIQVIIQSENIDVRRLPWHLWDFLKPYRKAEIALSSPFYDRTLKTAVARNKIRILSILGDDKGIDIAKDRQLLAQIDAETTFIVKPNRQQLNEQLWSEQGWDILCFSGHSSSEMDGSNGYIKINDTDKLTIPELKNSLRTAIERGLQIAIFNSCDGLGLANQLASLHIPQIIVMREPVPDVVAQEFLKNFLTAFAGGRSFYLAVREARERLQGLENHFPCASWLPVICQNPAEIPPTWESLRGTSRGN